ncbi:S66 peptidase family protein [Picrophilus oshimae]|nr:LD-carboxypeptidase [Picrophilus oshimae]AAT42832.1 muramoyltetrapeptide carboxypeptidase [Picrophilus oshimae DSM 9789]
MNRIRPERLKPGDEIRVIAPASAPDLLRLSRGVARLKKLGFKVSLGRNLKKLVQRNDLAAPAKERADELMAAFRDDNVKAVICARGGYGSIHILPLIDYDVIKEHPKIFVGYSDITALHLAINRNTNLITFHGPMVASDIEEMNKPTFKSFLDVLMGKSQKINIYEDRIIKYIIPGTVDGISLGTNISLVASLLGTNYLPEPDNRIFFIEDTDVTTGDIDRYFFSMKLAGILDKFNGFVFGDFKAIFDKEEPMPSIEDVVQKYMNELNKTSLYGAPFGHGEEQMIIPLNARIRISSEDPYIELIEEVVD